MVDACRSAAVAGFESPRSARAPGWRRGKPCDAGLLRGGVVAVPCPGEPVPRRVVGWYHPYGLVLARPQLLERRGPGRRYRRAGHGSVWVALQVQRLPSGALLWIGDEGPSPRS